MRQPVEVVRAAEAARALLAVAVAATVAVEVEAEVAATVEVAVAATVEVAATAPASAVAGRHTRLLRTRRLQRILATSPVRALPT